MTNNDMNKAKTQWYHFMIIIISGMGFFKDAYDLFFMTTVTKLLGWLYYYDPTSRKPGSLAPNLSATVNSVALYGTLAGQLFFGWLSDKLGRNKVYEIKLMAMVVSAITSGLSFGNMAKSIMTKLCFFRFWLGFDISGNYPLSTMIMLENAKKWTHGVFIAIVFTIFSGALNVEFLRSMLKNLHCG